MPAVACVDRPMGAVLDSAVDLVYWLWGPLLRFEGRGGLAAEHRRVANGSADRPAIVLRVSVADTCGLRCAYCSPADAGTPVSLPPLLPFRDVIRVALACREHAGSVRVRITGGEPLVRPGVEKLVAMLCREGIADVSLTTNGLRLAEMAGALADAGLVRVNVSLDTLDPAVFRCITGGDGLAAVIAGIHAAREAGLTPVKLNCVVMRGTNDLEVCDLLRFALGAGCEMRFIELMPMGPAASWHRRAFVSADEVRSRLTEEFDLQDLPEEGPSPARMVEARCRRSGLAGRVGFIAPVSRPFCSGCARLRLTSRGELLSCLKDGTGESLTPLLERPDAETGIVRAVARALSAKQTGRAEYSQTPMVAVGG